MRFQLTSRFQPTGDQPQAIPALVDGVRSGVQAQILRGATGTGKTFTLANVIQAVQLPTLLLSPNKTLADQTYKELAGYFPNNAVRYFVSDYDYYTPAGYDPGRDAYSPKRATLDAELTRSRMASIVALLTRQDVIVVASVSALFPLGSPEVHRRNLLTLTVGETVDVEQLVDRLTAMRYVPNEAGKPLEPSQFRDHGDSIEVFSPAEELPYEIEFRDDAIERIFKVDAVTGEEAGDCDRIVLPMAYVFILPRERIEGAVNAIRNERTQQIRRLRSQGNRLAIQRLTARTDYDTKMLLQQGWCPGMENYHPALSGLPAGTPPFTLFDYFPSDFLLVVDESHITVPQIQGLAAGDRTRKERLIEHGTVLPSSLDYRPLTISEWEQHADQVIFLSATPRQYELDKAGGQIVEQLIRPTGVPDPIVELVPKRNQTQRLEQEIRQRVETGERTLVMARTIEQAERVAGALADTGFRCEYLHGEQTTKVRNKLLKEFREGDEFDVLVGIGLVREGVDVPAASLVAILDADIGGLHRDETSLIQLVGRAARNVNGKVLMFADTVTGSMQRAITETRRRRLIQVKHNRAHGITPRTVGE